MKMLNKTAIILLSGGLDSYVSLKIAQKKYDIKLALTFDYGQIALDDEIEASKKMTKKEGICHKVIKLPFLADLSGDTLKNVWIPNRNGLFINVAGCFCDKEKYDAIIFGANIEEAKAFKDNSKDYIKFAQKALQYSASNAPKIVTPLDSMTKKEIITWAIDNNLDFGMIKSCYNSKSKTGKKHCGVCPSCKLLKDALIELNKQELLKTLDF